LDAKFVEGSASEPKDGAGECAKGSATLRSTHDLTPEIELGGGAVCAASRFANNIDLTRVPGSTRGTRPWLCESRDDIRLKLFHLTGKH
jgi:hypothetical protein